jgi:hypothetical protein
MDGGDGHGDFSHSLRRSAGLVAQKFTHQRNVAIEALARDIGIIDVFSMLCRCKFMR